MALSAICGVALWGLAAAQAAAADAAGASEVSEIVVTGSRIPQPNLTSISPIQVVSSKEVQLGGRPATIDILNQLPQVTQNAAVDLGPTSNPLSGPGGVGTVDLRGLGPQRTLVLVDSKRLGVGDPNTGNPNPAPDINQIPSQLIDHIEVLTGGASATYGSDAVAGVVNFVMKHNFEGVQMDAQFGVYEHGQQSGLVQGLETAKGIPIPGSEWDGKSRDLSAIFGLNAPDGKGNVTAYLTYHSQDPVKDSHRDYANCQVAVTAGALTCAGSSSSNLFTSADGTFAGTYSVLGNNFIVRGSQPTTPPALFNANPYEDLIQQNSRYTGGYFANYQVNKNVELYSTASFMNDRSSANVAPSGLFQSPFNINCNNPFLSAQQQTTLNCSAANIAAGATRSLLIGRRNVEGGPRRSNYEHNNYRIVGGVRGDIFGSWKYDVYGSYYYTSLDFSAQNFLSLNGIQDALLVGGTRANPVCLSGNPNCVPYNIFQDGGVTQAAVTSLNELGTSRGTSTQRIVEATVTGDLGDYGVKSPWAKDGVGVAFGAQQRRDHLFYAPDAAQESGDLSGFGGASVRLNNSIRTNEAYGELRIPLISDMDFAKDVVGEAGYRYSDYSTGIIARTWKLGLQWAPIDDIRFRTSYNKAIRAPDLLSLYNPASVTNTSVVSDDPCAQNSVAPATLAECQRTGVTAANYGKIPQCPAGQCATLQGGNNALGPETFKTFTIGFTSRPRWVSGLTFGLDYYHIDQKDLIGNISIDIVLNRCLTTGNSTFCSLITRNPINGKIFGTTTLTGNDPGYISGALTNIGSGVNEGVDVQGDYNLPLSDWGIDSWGGVSLSLNGSLLTKATTVPLPGDKAYDCAGLYGAGCNNTVNPKWRHNFRVTWNTPWHNLALSAAWRYIGESKFYKDTNEPSIGQGTTDKFNHLIAAVNYMDLAGIWRVNDMVSVRGGVNNVFDKDPPVILSAYVGTGLPNTYPTYDLLGRKFFMGITANF